MISAFGVDHGVEIAKYSLDPKDPSGQKMSLGRRTLSTVAPGIHAPIAGQKGKKLRALGNSAAGTLGGAVAGSLLTRGRPVGGLAGGYTGAVLGANRNQRKGYYKQQKMS